MDRYTKTVLTVIAAALCAIAAQLMGPAPAGAQFSEGCGSSPSNACYIEFATDPSDPCGDGMNPCHIKLDPDDLLFGLPVRIVN